MGDTDFPTRLGNQMASNPAGYLQAYVRGMKEYEQAGTNIPSYRVQDEYAQEKWPNLYYAKKKLVLLGLN